MTEKTNALAVAQIADAYAKTHYRMWQTYPNREAYAWEHMRALAANVACDVAALTKAQATPAALPLSAIQTELDDYVQATTALDALPVQPATTAEGEAIVEAQDNVDDAAHALAHAVVLATKRFSAAPSREQTKETPS